MEQEERLRILVRAFLDDSVRYASEEVPSDITEQKQLLRALMNIRPPGRMDQKTILLQDEYLREENRRRGILTLNDIPSIREQYGCRSPFSDIISLWQGDITRLKVGAIVNAANSRMLGCFQPLHGCIDNCIHTYAGIELRAECARQMQEMERKYGPGYEQPTAVPMLTDGYNLPADHVVHIVGPIATGKGVTPELSEDLRLCYQRTLDLCFENEIKSVAFCCISTGVFRFPADQAACIAVKAVEDWLRGHRDAMERVIFNVYIQRDRKLYEDILDVHTKS